MTSMKHDFRLFLALALGGSAVLIVGCDKSATEESVASTNSPARHIELEGEPNFRDLGGYETTDGRTVKWRTVFRTGELGQLSDADVEVYTLTKDGRDEALLELDFRVPGECELAYFGVIVGLAAILGPILGGILIEWDVFGLGWRLVFLINLPIGLGAFLVGLFVLPKRDPEASLRRSSITTSVQPNLAR